MPPEPHHFDVVKAEVAEIIDAASEAFVGKPLSRILVACGAMMCSAAIEIGLTDHQVLMMVSELLARRKDGTDASA